MDQHDDFDSVSWRNYPDSDDNSRPTTSGSDADDSRGYDDNDVNGKQAVPMADTADNGGSGEGILECRVDSPLKENDGTKDAFVSYLITTHVCGVFLCFLLRDFVPGQLVGEL